MNGKTTALSYVLQNTAAKQQILNCVPNAATAVYYAIARRRERMRAQIYR